jgi:prophage tail gpP-like protein
MTTELKVNGDYYGGWESVNIERGIEQIAGTFELSVTDRWNTDQGQQAFGLQPGQACEVLVDGQTVITGYTDSVNPSYDARSHSITVSGRDKTADLVDCSAIYKSGQWSNKKIEQIAADLVAPFGIQVIVAADTGAALPIFAIQEGASVFEELERAAKMRALLLMSDGLGNLLLTRAGTVKSPTGLTEGENILTANGKFDWKDRFSDYIVKGQSKGDDDNYGETVAHRAASVKDAGINRYRPLIVIAEDQDGNATLRQRAEWERNVRSGRGARATITVQGWTVNGQLWQPNTLTWLRSPRLSADRQMLIVSVGFSLDESGTVTTLELANPHAFDMIEGVKQTRLEKKIRKAQGDESSIVQPEWEWKP